MDGIKSITEFFLGRLGFKKLIFSCAVVLSIVAYFLNKVILVSVVKLNTGQLLSFTDYVLLFSSLVLAILILYCFLVIVEVLYYKASKVIEVEAKKRENTQIAIKEKARMHENFDKTFIHLPSIEKEYLYALLDGSTSKVSKRDTYELIKLGFLDVVAEIYDDNVVSLSKEISGKVQAMYDVEIQKAFDKFRESSQYKPVLDLLRGKVDVEGIDLRILTTCFGNSDLSGLEYSKYVGVFSSLLDGVVFTLNGATRYAIEQELKEEVIGKFTIPY